MEYWSRAPQSREQLVLFAARLDDALASDHTVRLLDEILGRLDWSAWEAAYDGRRGQPPIHPRVLASASLRVGEAAKTQQMAFSAMVKAIIPCLSTPPTTT